MTATMLFRNEMLKTYKRLAFWVTFLFFAFVNTMDFGEEFYSARQGDGTFALPGAWRDILTGNAEVALIFGSVILILLLASEFSWRTARQNVIDGLSKEQFFFGKSMILPTVALVFVTTQVVLGAIFALLGTDVGQLTEPIMTALHWRIIAGVLLAFIGYASLALFVSLAIRNSGPAMAVWFFYVALGERMLAGAMRAVSDGLGAAAQFLPINTFNQLHRYLQFDAAAFQQAVQNAVENNRQPPADPWAWGTLLLTSAIWISLFWGGAFVWFRQRDL